MTNLCPNVLILSSVSPFEGAGTYAYNYYTALKNRGLDVDFLTKSPIPGHPEIAYVEDGCKETGFINRKLERRQRHRYRHISEKYPVTNPQYCFSYIKEQNPPVSYRRIIRKIKSMGKKYDVIMVVFWAGMLSFKTIKEIHNEFRSQIHFNCPDFLPVTGGCHFWLDCDRIRFGCGKCPAFNSDSANDITRSNVKYRKNVYKKVHPIVYGNTYMNNVFRQSYLLHNYDRCEKVFPIIDNDLFSPGDKKSSRNKFNLGAENKFIITFGNQLLTEKRKGIDKLIAALDIVYNRLSDKQRSEIALMIIGNNIESIKPHLKFKYIYLGYVPYKDLPDIYNASDLFLSPSISDAGPTMVNMALSTGIPVVSFATGTALDMIKDEGTGYCANIGDIQNFADGIFRIYSMDASERSIVSKRCREIALSKTQPQIFVDFFLDTFRKYNSDKHHQ